MSARAFAAIGLLIVLVLVCFRGLVVQPDALIVDDSRPSLDHAGKLGTRGLGNDLTFFILPKYTATIGLRGTTARPTFWDDSGFGGRPLVGNPQAGLFYPPTRIASWSALPSSLGWLTIAHLIWAGLGTFALVKSLGASDWSAMVAAGCFESSPYLLGHVFEGHYPHVWSVSWYPWAFRAYLLVRTRRPLGVMILPFVLAASFLTGHPQEWYYLVLALSGWALADAAWALRARRLGKAAGGLLVWSGLLGICLSLCAIEIAPGMAVQPWLLKGSAIPIGRINHYYLHSINVFQLLSPFALGRPHDYFGHDNYWETVCSVGLVPLVLAYLGGARHPNTSARLGFLGLLAGAVVLACGRRLGVFTLAYRFLPGMNRFRVPSRTLFVASLAAAVLAGLGTEFLWKLSASSPGWIRFRKLLRNFSFALILTLVSAGLFARVHQGPAMNPNEPGLSQSGELSRMIPALTTIAGEKVLWAATSGLLLVALWPVRMGMTPRLASLALGLFALTEVGALGQGLIAYTSIEKLISRDRIFEYVGASTMQPSGPMRVAASPRALPDLVAARRGTSKSNVNDTFQIQHAADLYEQLYPYLEDAVAEKPGVEMPMDREVARFRSELARTVLDRMSVRCVMTTHPNGLQGLVALDRSADLGSTVEVALNPTALPRAYVVPKRNPLGETQAPHAATLARIDAREAVVLECDPLPPGGRQPFTPVESFTGPPDHVAIGVTTEAPGLLVVATTWMPGWSALVDGVAGEVLRGDFWLQVVPLRTAGRHKIVLRYIPPGFALGVAVSAATAIAWIVVGLALWHGAKKGSAKSG